MPDENRRFDIVVFGSSGYTGCYVVQELTNSSGNFKWCVAGRNREKVRSALNDVAKLTGKNLDNIEIIEANVEMRDSIVSMCQQTKLVINCVGPYRFFGERVVDACVSCGTHHIDVSGEPQFLEKMQLKHFDAAREKGIYVVGACGFDSIPCDLAVEIMKDRFNGDVNSIESYLQFKSAPGSAANFGTWQSAIYGLAQASELKPLRKQLKEKLFTAKMPKNHFPVKKRPTLFKSKEINKWCIPFIGSDKSIVLRTQMYNYQFRKQRPVQMQTYMGMPSLLYALGTLFMGLIFFVLARFRVGQRLLEKYPEIFSFGAFSKDQPPMRKASDGSFRITLKANGWSEKLNEPTDQHSYAPDKSLRLIVDGPEPYVTTAFCVTNAAFIVLTEKEKMPDNGGVLTPGAAFRETTLAQKLEPYGLTFKLEE